MKLCKHFSWMLVLSLISQLVSGKFSRVPSALEVWLFKQNFSSVQEAVGDRYEPCFPHKGLVVRWRNLLGDRRDLHSRAVYNTLLLRAPHACAAGSRDRKIDPPEHARSKKQCFSAWLLRSMQLFQKLIFFTRSKNVVKLSVWSLWWIQ